MSGTCEWCGHDLCVCDDRPKAQEKDGIVADLTARLAEAEAAARWCYRILVDNQDLSHFFATDQWPWLADEAARGGRDE